MPTRSATVSCTQKGYFMRRISLFLICLTTVACSTTDYEKNYSLVNNCDFQFQENAKSNLVSDKKYTFELGGKNSSCYSNGQVNQFYQLVNIPENSELLTIWSNPNLSLNHKSFFLPQLFIKNKNGLTELPFTYEIKGSAFPTESYYVYHYDLRNIDANQIVVTTNPDNYNKLFDYEHLNSYDYSSITKSKMPFAKGAKLDLVAYSKYNLKW